MWTQIYLVCFLLGFSLSAVSWLLGVMGLHLPHLHAHGAGAGHGAPAPAAIDSRKPPTSLRVHKMRGY